MIYYKHNKTGDVYAYEEEQMSHPIVIEAIKDMTLMTDEEIEEHLNPTPTEEELAQQARWERDSLLEEIDKVVTNPLRWNSLSDDKKEELSEYRQALLDVPQQEGFPHNIEWPVSPL